MSRAARVDTTDYEFSHSKAPRGEGAWWFGMDSKSTDPAGKQPPFSFNGSYSAAKKAAVAEAAKRNVSVVYALA